MEGPKACGKTATASRVAATKFEMDEDATARASIELNSDYLFDHVTPILFDEWQAAPELWNRVRRAVDAAEHRRGLYLLTGSATPKDDTTRHSGAGRFGVLRMRPMSLFESVIRPGKFHSKHFLEGPPRPGGATG
ncbi:AAA family ATPase [Leucobacter sp. GX24907]